jgi:hypothetical protein
VDNIAQLTPAAGELIVSPGVSCFRLTTMTSTALLEARLVAQGLADPTASSAATVLTGSGPMQGQELPGVTSSLALRLAGGTERVDRVVQEFDNGDIVRGYPMRSTVFALAAADAAWVTPLCSGTQRRQSARHFARHDISGAMTATAEEVLLAHPDGLTRSELTAQWRIRGLPEDRSFTYLMVRDLMLRGVAVYGPTEGREQRVVPTAGHLPSGSDLAGRFNGDAVAATAELLRRYLRGHGPAGLRDFAWWTKLPQRQIRAAFSEVRGDVEPAPPEFSTTLGEDAFVRPGLMDEVTGLRKKAHGTFLLPSFDEIVLGYRDRLAVMADDHHRQVAPGNNGAFRKSVVRGGRFIATWSAPANSSGRRLDLSPFRPLSAAAVRDSERAFRDYPHGR